MGVPISAERGKARSVRVTPLSALDACRFADHAYDDHGRHDSNGREHARHFARKVEAQRWLDEVIASVVMGQYVDPKAGRITFRDYAEQWRRIAGAPTLEPGTRRDDAAPSRISDSR